MEEKNEFKDVNDIGYETETIETDSVNEVADKFKAPEESEEVHKLSPGETELYEYFNDKYSTAFTLNSFENNVQLEVMKLNVQMSIFGELKRIADSLDKPRIKNK